MSISKNDHCESSPSCHSYGFCDQGIMVLFYHPPNQHNYCIEINHVEVETFTDLLYLWLFSIATLVYQKLTNQLWIWIFR